MDTPPPPESEPPAPASNLKPTRVWDLPTRLFHWTLVACVLGALVTGSQGGDAMVGHLRFGQMLLALLAFRLIWALIGGRWSRWAHFQWWPRRGSPAGHAFPGSWSVLAILAVLSLQVATGLVADDEIATTGPLSALAPEAWVRWATAWHKGLGEAAVWTLIGLHLSAIAWYVARGRSLIEPMVSGDRLLPPGEVPARDGRAQRLGAFVVVAATLALAVWVFRFGAVA